jgi:serine protease Do
MAPASTATLVVLRKGEEKTIEVTLGELPNDLRHAGAEEHDQPSDNAPRLGLNLAPAREVAGAGSEGVVVTAVSPDGPAAERGFEAGDVILDVGGKAVSTPADVRSALAEARKASKHTVLIRVKSVEGTKFVAVPISHA